MSVVSITCRGIVCALATVIVAAPAVAHAQAPHVSFAGTWVLDAGKSDSSPLVPTGVKYVVTDSAGRINIWHEIAGTPTPNVGTLSFTTDGKPTTSRITTSAGPVDATTTGTWAGDTLRVKNAFSISGTDVVQTDAWTLSPDGKSITLARSVLAGGQPLAAKLVLVKQ